MISAFDSLPSSALSPRQNLVSLRFRTFPSSPVQSSSLTTHNITIVPRHTQRLFLPSAPRIYGRLRLHKRSKIVYSPGFGFCSRQSKCEIPRDIRVEVAFLSSLSFFLSPPKFNTHIPDVGRGGASIQIHREVLLIPSLIAGPCLSRFT